MDKHIFIFIYMWKFRSVYCANSNPEVEDEVELDISICKNTREYTYANNPDENVRSYKAKFGVLFSKVKNRDYVIWGKDKSTDVILKGVGDDENYMAILLISGNYLLLYKPGKNKQWIDITKSRLDVKKLKIVKSDGTPFNGCDYTISLHYFSYKIELESDCVEIRFDEKLIWKRLETKGYGYPTSLFLNLINNNLILSFKGNMYKSLDLNGQEMTVTLGNV